MIDDAERHLLRHPAWSALAGGNRDLGEGGPLARRFHPEVSPFAGVSEPSPAAFEALAALVPPGGEAVLSTPEKLEAPPGFAITLQAPITQMVLEVPIAGPPAGGAVVELGAADIPDMLDLTARTRPGPFGPRTIEFGGYLGLRVDGALAAMAGQRMRFGRFAEISAVCVDPAHRGRGHAGMLMSLVAAAIQARGLTPFLHVFDSNTGAIALYEKLGFTRSVALNMTVLARTH